MDTEHTMSPDINLEDVVATESISVEEMDALRIYFERYSQEMLTSFRVNLSPEDDLLHFLQRQLVHTKSLLSSLEKPWDRYIPILYRAFSLYYIHVTDKNKRQLALNLSTELMSVIVLLSKSGRLLSRLCAYYSNQSEMLKKCMDDSK